MHQLKNKYKYVIFDFDGTVNNTSPGIYATFKKVLDHFGVDWTNINFDKHIGPPLDYSYKHLVGEENMNQAIELHRQIFIDDNAAANSFLYDGIVDTIAALKKGGYCLAIASSKYEPHVLHSVEYLGLSDYFDFVYGQNDRRGYKSEVLRQLIDDNGWDRSKCLMIGDTSYDMIGAKDNNVDFLAVSYGFGDLDEMKRGNPVAVADTPKQIAEMLL